MYMKQFFQTSVVCTKGFHKGKKTMMNICLVKAKSINKSTDETIQRSKLEWNSGIINLRMEHKARKRNCNFPAKKQIRTSGKKKMTILLSSNQN